MEENQQQFPSENQAIQPATPIQPLPKPPLNKFLPILLIIIAFILTSITYFYITLKTPERTTIAKKSIPSTAPIKQSSNVNSETELSGKIQEISQDLGLIVQTKDNKINNFTPITTYYSAGTYVAGKYKGYTRYVAVNSSSDQMGYRVRVFTTNDNKNYILDGAPQNISSLKEDDYQSPIYGLNKSKIVKIDNLDTSLPYTISLNSIFALNRNDFITQRIETDKKDSLGNIIDKFHIVTDFSSYTTLKSPNPRLTLYSGKRMEQYHEPTITPTPLPEDSYIDGTTQVIAVDSTGLAYSYDMTDRQKAALYPEKMNTFNKAIADLERSGKKDPYPDYPTRPNLALSKSDIQTTTTIYDKYNIAIPAGCATDVNTIVVKNITDQDLVKIGTSPHGDIYILSSKNHPLIKAEYDKKIGIYNDPLNSDLYTQVNKSKKPTYDEYVAKNPLIFMKDYWGRWVALGEYDINLPGGCGKPVVYLYPTKPTKVSIRFTTPIKFDVTIPSYNNGWNVLAQPNGALTDLQPKYTDCNLIDDSKKGSEYAKSACLSNQYPYLYWAGQSTEKQYPKVDKGWIVESKNLTAFLNQKLDEVEFTQKEKQDFLEYWLPELKSKNANYYRLSFLQTPEMNSIAPMQIIPQPENVYRLFLDYSAYKNKPASSIEPQNLSKVVRNGFTVVEWGGLKGVLLK